jgi:twinkle protein
MHANDSASINQLLLGRMEELCMHLLPNGKAKGNHWVVGGIDGEAGASLQVTLNGSAAGRFIDFANKDSKGATPLWLWSKVRNLSFSSAIREAKEWLGVKDDNFGVKRHKPKVYSKPNVGGVRPLETNTEAMDYLVGERRIDPIVVANSKVSETEDGKAIVFNFADYDDESKRWIIAHRKYLRLARPDGKKDTWTTKGTKRCLFGKNLITDNDSELVICEGEIDALSWNSWKIPAVSLPNGVLDFEWCDVDWEWLARFEKIYVSTDMDEPGRACSLEICKRLGLHRCYIVALPKKDANECLVTGMTREQMDALLKAAKGIELDEIKRPEDFKTEVLDYYNTDPSLRGADTPWTPALPWRVRKGELTILSGFSGHGKTAMLNQLMLHLLAANQKIMDASLEIKPGMTLYNMTRCALGKKQSDKAEIEGCISWINDSMFFLDCIGTVNVTRLMSAMEYARKRHGIDVFVIDSLFKCGLSGEDYAGARDFVDKLTTFCNNTGCHIILVAHSRKVSSGNEFSVPTKSDVAGSSDICNAAFNVIIVWRNKLKKKKMDEIMHSTTMDPISKTEELVKWMDQPDGQIVIDKQRFGEGEESAIPVFFEKESCQFHPTQGMKTPYFKINL